MRSECQLTRSVSQKPRHIYSHACVPPLFNHIFHGTLALISFMRISGFGAARSALSRVNSALLQGLQL